MFSSMKREWNDFRKASVGSISGTGSSSRKTHNPIVVGTGDTSTDPMEETTTTDSSSLSFGKTFGTVYYLLTYNTYQWLIQFFLPITMVLFLVNTYFTTNYYAVTYKFLRQRQKSIQYELDEEDERPSRLSLLLVNKWTIDCLGVVLILYILIVATAIMVYGIADLYAIATKNSNYQNSTTTTGTTSVVVNPYKKQSMFTPFFKLKHGIVQTVTRIGSLFVLAVSIGVPFYIVIHGIFEVTDRLVAMIEQPKQDDEDDVHYILVHLLSIGSVAIEIIVMIAILYYTTFFMIIVIPVVLFENINYPFVPLLRSYQLTSSSSSTSSTTSSNKRYRIFIMIFVYSCVWFLVEGIMELIRESIVKPNQISSRKLVTSIVTSYLPESTHEHFNHPYLMKTYTYMDSMIWWFPATVFVPFLAILQTIIYMDVSQIREMKQQQRRSGGAGPSNNGTIPTTNGVTEKDQ